MITLDSALIVSCLLAAFSIRLGYWFWPNDDLMLVIMGAPIIAVPIFIRFGLYRAVVRYIGFKALWAIINAVFLYALIWGVVGFMAALDGIPRSVIIINWLLSLMAIGGLRIIARLIISGDVNIFSNNINSKQKQVLVYGAGDAGVQLVSGLEYSSEYNPVGFIDDATDLQSNQIRGLNIYRADDIDTLINRFNLDEILIAIPSLSRSNRSVLLEKLEVHPVEVRLLPGVSELADGKVNIDDLREVDINDLLGRDIIQANKELLVQNITKKTVVVTGAGGSIGSELCRQVISLKPSALIMYEINELALYTIEKELLAKSSVAIYPILGSVNNSDRLTKIFKRFNVDTIYHTAAYKHVPMVEFNNTEGVNNNIFGTLSCAQSAIKSSVKTFVLISTDKAVRPTNTMGATKRCAELILQALADNQSVTTFSMVRFGNVLGSSGSVIPLFKQQIRDGGPVTVTNKDIIRYFMTIPEAVELVIQAGAMSTGGDVFVLDMGEPVRIDDLARKMIHLTGLVVKDNLNPNGDIEIEYIGLRPGEKLFEELLIGDNVSKTGSPLIMKAQEEMLSWSELELILDNLRLAVDDDMHVKLRKLLIKAVPGFKPQCGIEDILYKN
jgi:FlaA1/EpsC-like NDP-sugar epimerase